jgi:hypothetical protein
MKSGSEIDRLDQTQLESNLKWKSGFIVTCL